MGRVEADYLVLLEVVKRSFHSFLHVVVETTCRMPIKANGGGDGTATAIGQANIWDPLVAPLSPMSFEKARVSVRATFDCLPQSPLLAPKSLPYNCNLGCPKKQRFYVVATSLHTCIYGTPKETI